MSLGRKLWWLLIAVIGNSLKLIYSYRNTPTSSRINKFCNSYFFVIVLFCWIRVSLKFFHLFSFLLLHHLLLVQVFFSIFFPKMNSFFLYWSVASTKKRFHYYHSSTYTGKKMDLNMLLSDIYVRLEYSLDGMCSAVVLLSRVQRFV